MGVLGVIPVVKVDDLDKALDFYTSALGFHETFRWGDPPFYAGVSIEVPDQATQSALHLNQTADEPGRGELYVSVDDVDAAFSRVQAAGVAIEVELKDQPYGMRDFSVRDPAGNFVTVGQPTAPGG